MIALFVLKLSAGITLMWWLMPRHEVTDGFFRIQMRLVMALAVLATLLLARNGTWELAIDPAGRTAAQSASAAAVQMTVDLNPTATAQSILAKIRGWQFRTQLGVGVIAYVGSVSWTLGRRFPGNLCIHAMMLGCC